MYRSVRFLLIVMVGCGLFAAKCAWTQTFRPPRSFEAIAVSPTEIRLYWLPALLYPGYQIERDGHVIATLPTNVLEYDDKGLAPDSMHRYSLRAVGEGDTPSSPLTYVERTFAPWPASAHTGHLPELHFDVVVAQASSGGVAAAIEAGRRGLKVALIEPTTRVGGMPVNGLSATDLRRPAHASGFFVRFQDRIHDLYAAEGISANGLSYEPRIALQAMKSLLYVTPNITLFRLTRPVRVLRHPSTSDGSRACVDGVVVEEVGTNGMPTGQRMTLKASVFIDATDCGDIAAWAGAPFRLGREARSAREPHNGVIYYDRADDKLLPGSTGKADHRIMAYTYLLTVKDYGPGADRTIPKPPGYRKEDFTHTPAWKQSWAVTSGRMPGDKLELNQHPEGGDIQEINYRYPLDSYAERARLETIYRNHVLGYLYYIQTEQGQKQIGLPNDEYRDTGGFPPLLYVREGRRILGEQLPDEKEITDALALTRPESVGIGDYPMDSHAVRPKTDWSTPDMGEGEWWLYRYTPVHELPLGILVPRTLDNVFVTTAVSSTHVSFGTYRLEPVRMAFGQAAGIAADLCIRFHLKAREVPARQVQDELLPHVANPYGDPAVSLRYYPDIKSDSPNYRAIMYLIAHGVTLPGDNFRPEALTTHGELALLLTQLADRASQRNEILSVEKTAQGTRYTVKRDFFAYMGPRLNRSILAKISNTSNLNSPITRAEFAHGVAELFANSQMPPQNSPYSDLPNAAVSRDAGILYSLGIDSILWDSWNAFDKDRLRFQPDAPLQHDQVFEALYIAQIGLGPLFNDSPVDAKNGWPAPAAPTVIETVVGDPNR